MLMFFRILPFRNNQTDLICIKPDILLSERATSGKLLSYGGYD